MPEKYNKLNTSKLKFKKSWLEAGEIQVRAKNGKLYPQSRENLILSIERGFNLDKVDNFFTAESIALAIKKTSKDESKDPK